MSAPQDRSGLIYVHYQVFAGKPSLQFDPSSRDGCVGKGGYFWFQFQGCLRCFALQIDYHLTATLILNLQPFAPHFKQQDRQDQGHSFSYSKKTTIGCRVWEIFKHICIIFDTNIGSNNILIVFVLLKCLDIPMDQNRILAQCDEYLNICIIFGTNICSLFVSCLCRFLVG